MSAQEREWQPGDKAYVEVMVAHVFDDIARIDNGVDIVGAYVSTADLRPVGDTLDASVSTRPGDAQRVEPAGGEVEAATEDVVERAARIVHGRGLGPVQDAEMRPDHECRMCEESRRVARALAAARLLAGGRAPLDASDASRQSDDPTVSVPGRSEAEGLTLEEAEGLRLETVPASHSRVTFAVATLADGSQVRMRNLGDRVEIRTWDLTESCKPPGLTVERIGGHVIDARVAGTTEAGDDHPADLAIAEDCGGRVSAETCPFRSCPSDHPTDTEGSEP